MALDIIRFRCVPPTTVHDNLEGGCCSRSGPANRSGEGGVCFPGMRPWQPALDDASNGQSRPHMPKQKMKLSGPESRIQMLIQGYLTVDLDYYCGEKILFEGWKAFCVAPLCVRYHHHGPGPDGRRWIRECSVGRSLIPCCQDTLLPLQLFGSRLFAI